MSQQDHNDHDHSHDAPLPAELPPTPVHGYWKSLAELDGKAAWQLQPSRKEFADGIVDRPADPMSRRNFFHLMGASMALAGVGACQRYEKDEIVPLARRPEDQVPGTTLQYATAYELAGVGHSLLATSFEGRPIHLDGNPEHPFAGGGIVPGTKRRAGAHTFVQASILHLYDPDRSQNPTNNSKGASMEAFRTALPALRDSLKTGGAHVLAEASSSPTLRALKQRLTQLQVQWHEYEPLSWDNERTGTRLAFNRPMRPIARLDKCKTIVTLDCDLFVEHPASMKYSRDFARSRRVDGSLGLGAMNRLWSIEATFTNTGALADHRLPMRAEFGLPFAMALDAELSGGAAPSAEFLKEDKVSDYLKLLATELRENHGTSVIIAGRRQPPEVHALVAKLNQTIGAPGATLDYYEDPDPDRVSHLQAITQLGKEMSAGRVQTLIILGGNPVYDAPADLDFAGGLAKVATSLHLSEYDDETSKKCTWHVPKAHFLEAWGDVETWDGTLTVAQPLIAPLFGGVSSAELVSLLLGEEKGGLELVRTAHNVSDLDWKKRVHDGFVADKKLATAAVQVGALPAFRPNTSQLSGSKRGPNELEVVFHYSSSTYDGRFANNAWLQETPDFLTKVTWDNYALVSPETADTLKLKNDTMITIKIGDRSVDVCCYTMPGQARYSIGLVLGGGRTEAGHVATHPHNVSSAAPPKRVVGWDTYKVRTTAGFDIATGCSVTGGGAHYELADTQDHWDYRPGLIKDVGEKGIEERLPELVHETSASNYVQNRTWKAEEEAEFWDDVDQEGKHKLRHLSLFEEHEYGGHRWGMAIDLNTCTGCNACMIACQSENNVPVVGRQEVINNREMSWIRIDRYFQGDPDDPHVVHQPVGCQQCENAPCEQVCPVGATSHSDEGLNDMAYNRCIGTRYCANNCPYKVRRFNFLDWNKEFREARSKVRRLLFNPDVTVRMRGVMEKCTYCVQRIQNAKIKAKAEIRSGKRAGSVTGPLMDGEVETACQSACPTEAIVFGDLEDKNSRVSVLHADRRGYGLLPEVYTKPRTRYLARVRNIRTPDGTKTPAPANEGGAPK